MDKNNATEIELDEQDKGLAQTKTDQVETEQAQATQSAPTTVVKKSGTALSLLAILIALGVGASGYYFGQQQVTEIQQKLTALESQVSGMNPSQVASNTQPSQDHQQLVQLETVTKSMESKVAQVEQLLAMKDQAIASLQTQLNQVSSQSKAQQPNDWLLSEADFLLNNALRKLVLDNDVDTSVSLLKLADETLEKVNSPEVVAVRAALHQDLKQLLSVTSVDQNAVMQRLSQLANGVDELTVLDVNFGDNENSEKLSDSIDDWKTNAEKSATSFLNRFIRITPKNANAKELLAPNQDIYLRENIRLRLQLAIMAVPRQQNELYKQSLDAVASWVRSYFDTNSEVTQNFLKSVDELAEISIYVDVPDQLQSLTALNKLLNRVPQTVQKVEIEVDKATEALPKAEQSNVLDAAQSPAEQQQSEPSSPANAEPQPTNQPAEPKE